MKLKLLLRSATFLLASFITIILIADENAILSNSIEHISSQTSGYRLFIMIAPFIAMLLTFLQIYLYSDRSIMKYVMFSISFMVLASNSIQAFNLPHVLRIILYSASILSILIFMIDHSYSFRRKF